MKTKDFALKIKEIGDDGTLEGYGSVFNNIDSYGEKVMPGAFAESLARHKREGTSVAMLWNHDTYQPIGIWDELSEDGKGLKAKGRFLLDIQRAREIYTLAKNKGIGGLSIGYREEDTDQDGEAEGRPEAAQHGVGLRPPAREGGPGAEQRLGGRNRALHAGR